MTDLFDTLGVARTFRDLDAAHLERRFHDLQRRYHPDKAFSHGETAGADSIDHSSLINAAYRTLRDEHARTKYLLSLYGYSVEQSKQVPMDLLELVMSVQESVAMLQAGAKLGSEFAAIEQDLNARIIAHKAETEALRNEWDTMTEHAAPGGELDSNEKRILESLTRSLATRAYLQTLYDTLILAKQGKSLVLKH